MRRDLLIRLYNTTHPPDSIISTRYDGCVTCRLHVLGVHVLGVHVLGVHVLGVHVLGVHVDDRLHVGNLFQVHLIVKCIPSLKHSEKLLHEEKQLEDFTGFF